MLAGDLAAAERELRRDDEALAAIGEQYFRSTIAGLLAQVLVAQGRLPEASEYAAICQELASGDDLWSQVLWRTARARIEAHAGDLAAAERLAAEAVELADSTVDIELAADARVGQADVLVRGAEPEAAAAPLREALQRYDQKGDVVLAARVRERLFGPVEPAR